MDANGAQPKIVPFDSDAHKKVFVQMNVEYVTWISDQLKENYRVDPFSVLGQTIPEYVNDNLELFTSLRPPDGVLYMLEVEGEVAGMGALKKLDDEVGEIKRMYNRPHTRGRGYGRMMLNRLLEDGRKMGCSSFLLDSPRFSNAAHNLYRSVGFKEREAYPESEVPEMFRPFWIFMEK